MVKVRCQGHMHRLRVCYGDYTLAPLDHTTTDIKKLRVAEVLSGDSYLATKGLGCRCYYVLRLWEGLVGLDAQGLEDFISAIGITDHIPKKLYEALRVARVTLNREREEKHNAD